MSLNNLLTWMSARGRGSWSQFRTAVEELHVPPSQSEEDGEIVEDVTTSDLPLYQTARFSLQRLAHVEFYSPGEEADWRVVPPTIAVHNEGDRWVGILCGARSPDLRDRIGRGEIVRESQAAPGMPDRIQLAASDLAVLQPAASAMGLHIQLQAPLSLLAAIPPVDDPRSRVSENAPAVPGWTIERFRPTILRWTTRDATTERELEVRDVTGCQTGLFRFRMKYQRFHYLRWQGKTYKVNVQVGKYAVARHRRVRGLLHYDPSRSVLTVPVSCRPPLLIERALILCTGLLPQINALGRLEYTVPHEVARVAARLLRQEVLIQ